MRAQKSWLEAPTAQVRGKYRRLSVENLREWQIEGFSFVPERLAKPSVEFCECQDQSKCQSKCLDQSKCRPTLERDASSIEVASRGGPALPFSLFCRTIASQRQPLARLAVPEI